MFRFWLYWYKILIIFWQRRWGPSWVIRVAGDPAAPGDRRTWPLQPPARTSSSSLVSSPFKYICKYMMSIWNIFFTRLSSYTHIPIPEVTLHWEFNVRNYYSVGIITRTKKLFQLGVYTLGISSWNFHGLKIPNSVRIPNPLVSWIMLTLGDIEGVGAESARPPHRAQRVHIGKNISVSFQSLGGSINPAGQNERSVDDFVNLWTCSE